MKFEHYGIGIAKGMSVTLKNLLRRPVTTPYPEERLTVSRRLRGNELIWSKENCTGCATCVINCPHGVIDIAWQAGVRKAAEPSPCTQACPAGIDIPRYIRFIAQGKSAEAVATIREKAPFPAILGWVCLHFCEDKCYRGERLDEAIAIRALKRFAAEHDTGLWKEKSKVAPATGKRVAIVGSGPGGLTAAYYLAKLGHSVTVFEALPEPGGMMRVGIPEYRLPRHIIKNEIDEIKAVGVEIRLNTKVESLEELLKQGYDAILLAVGAHRGVKIPLPGADLEGVIINTDFLRDVSLGRKVDIGKRVVVLGGGNVAFDCARTSVRLGATDVHLACLEATGCMLANLDEIEEGEREGITIHTSQTFTRIVGDDGHVAGMECLDVKSFRFDSEGKLQVETVEGSEHVLPADTVIFAIGQTPDLGLVEGVDDIKTARRRVVVDPDSLATGKEGVFAAADAVTGTKSIIEAIADGRKSAISIDKYLGGEGQIEEMLAPPEETPPPRGKAEETWRAKMPMLALEERFGGFAEVEGGLSQEAAVEEASRCRRCDLCFDVEKFEVDAGSCISCGLCVEACPYEALFFNYAYERSKYRRGELVMSKEDLLLTDKKQRSGYAHPELEADLPRQTLLLDRAKYSGKVNKKDGA